VGHAGGLFAGEVVFQEANGFYIAGIAGGKPLFSLLAMTEKSATP
jgi:hypothetical protein